VTEHGVEHHQPYAVCMENGGLLRVRVCDRAWCGASPAICSVYGRWRVAVCDRAWCGVSPAICCVERHMLYVVCVCMCVEMEGCSA